VSDTPHAFEGTEAELLAMTRDLDQLHHDVGRPALHASIAEWTAELRERRPTSRRRFLLGTGGLVAGGAALAAVATTPGLAAAVSSSAGSNAAGGLGGLKGDLAIAGLAASLENLAVFAYGAAISAVTAGKFGAVPPAITTFATTAKAQHTDHGASWNAIITSAGKHAVTVTEPTLTPVVQQKFGQVTTLTDLATLAVLLENIAAQTYQVACTKVKSKGGVATAASIQPVEMQHAAILYFVLGKYPGVQDTSGTPLAFNPTSSAA
jgi:Ferritin-like domain